MNQPLPRRIAWFAPWMWRKRSLISAASIWLLIYGLSYGPVIAFAIRGGSGTTIFAGFFYLPLLLCGECCPAFQELLDWYWKQF